MFNFSVKDLGLDSLKDKIAETANLVSDSAKSASNSLVTGVNDATNSVTSSAEDLWNQHSDTVERIVVDGLIEVAEDKLNDQEFLINSFGTIYELLPMPIRLMISRDFFLRKCFSQKDSIQKKVIDVKTQRAGNLLLTDNHQMQAPLK